MQDGRRDDHTLEGCNSEKGAEESRTEHRIGGDAAAHAIVSYTQDGMILIQNVKGDPDSPRSWPNWKRYGIVILASFLNNLLTICASGYSTGADQLKHDLATSDEMVTLGLSTFICGLAFGPMLLAPLSEFYGRRPVYLATWALFVLFQIPVALAPNMATVIICRFLQGFFVLR